MNPPQMAQAVIVGGKAHSLDAVRIIDTEVGMIDMEIGKWCRVVEKPPTGKTRIFFVQDAAGNGIGEIRWYTTWRCYAFLPGRQTVFEPTCLRDIATFIDSIMAARKARARVEHEEEA